MMAETNERAEKGREILKSRAAQGEPGTKQPHAKDENVRAQEVVDELQALRDKHGAEVRGPSAGETQNHPVPPHERTTAPVGGAGIQAAAAALGAAQAHIETELIAEARLASDPRREQDQKKFEMGQRGDLAFLPPPTVDEVNNPPATPQEQVERDAPKLAAAEETGKQIRSGQVNPEPESVKDSQIRTGTGKPAESAEPRSTETREEDTSRTATPAERASAPPQVGGLRAASENTPPATGTPIK